MKKTIICTLIACMMLCCFSPITANAEEIARIDYTAVTENNLGNGIGRYGIGGVYRYYIDNELYYEADVLYCIDSVSGTDLSNVRALEHGYDSEFFGLIGLYGVDCDDIVVTMYMKQYDYLTELNGTVLTETASGCVSYSEATLNDPLVTDISNRLYLRDYEYTNAYGEVIKIDVVDTYSWGLSGYAFYDGTTLTTRSTLRSAPRGYKLSTNENGDYCFVKSSMTIDLNLDDVGFESYVSELFSGEYATYYQPYSVSVIDDNGFEYTYCYEFFIDAVEPLYLYYKDNKVYAYSDSAFTVLYRAYFDGDMYYHYENCESGSNLIYNYYVPDFAFYEADSYNLEFIGSALGKYEHCTSVSSLFTIPYSTVAFDEVMTYSEFLETYGDAPIGVPSPTPTPDISIGSDDIATEDLFEMGFTPSKVITTMLSEVATFRTTYKFEWEDKMAQLYKRPDAKIELKVAVLVGTYDAFLGVNDFSVEIYDIGAFYEIDKNVTVDLGKYMEKQSVFWGGGQSALNRAKFGYPSDFGPEYGVDYPLDKDRFEYAQVLGVFARYNIPEDDIVIDSKWRFHPHVLNDEKEYSWFDNSSLSDIGLNSVTLFDEIFVFSDDVLAVMENNIFMVKYNGSLPTDSEEIIDINSTIHGYGEDAMKNLVKMFPSLLLLMGEVPMMFSSMFGFLPEPIITVFAFAVSMMVMAGVIKLFK